MLGVVLDAGEDPAGADRGDTGRAGAHEGVADCFAGDVADDFVHQKVGLRRWMTKARGATRGARCHYAQFFGARADRMMIASPGVDVEFDVGSITLVRDRLRVRLLQKYRESGVWG